MKLSSTNYGKWGRAIDRNFCYWETDNSDMEIMKIYIISDVSELCAWLIHIEGNS